MHINFVVSSFIFKNHFHRIINTVFSVHYGTMKTLCSKNIVPKIINNTSQQDFGTRKVYCVSNVTFHAESKYAIKIFPSPTVFVQWPF